MIKYRIHHLTAGDQIAPLLSDLPFTPNITQSFSVLAQTSSSAAHGLVRVYRHSRANKGMLGDLYVLDTSRGKGLGHHLITTALKKARATGLTRLWLYVYPEESPAAFHLYQKLGFTTKNKPTKAIANYLLQGERHGKVPLYMEYYLKESH